jgi:polyhydroxyalkanoate synthesis regulator phasin
MMEQLKKLLLAGIGSAAFTYEKAGSFINEMVEKGKLTVDEGKELSEDIRKSIKTDFIPLTKGDLKSLFDETNFATKEDLYEIKERLNRIEETLYNNEERFIEIEEEIEEE